MTESPSNSPQSTSDQPVQPDESAAPAAPSQDAPSQEAPSPHGPPDDASSQTGVAVSSPPSPTDPAPAASTPAGSTEAAAPSAPSSEASVTSADAPAADTTAADEPGAAADVPGAGTADTTEGSKSGGGQEDPAKREKGKPQTGKPDGGQAAKQDKKAEDKKAEDKKAEDKKPKKKKPSGPDPAAITKRIGTTSEAALAYVADPDPKLARMSRKHREAVISEIPPVTAGALLGPDALCRHFLASAASGRYSDLFFLWDLFKTNPDDCKPVLASRQKAQEKARIKMRTATHLGLLGDAKRVAADIDRAAGLPWRWLREILEPMGPAIAQRPVVLAAMLRKQPDFPVEIPDDPSDRWLAEAAELRESGAEVPEAIDSLLGRFADRLPATLATLAMAHDEYPDRVPALIDRVDLDAPDIAAIMAWARDHGHGDQLVIRVAADVHAAADNDRASGLARWKSWQTRGVDVAMPESLAQPNLDGLDLGRPESADLIKVMVDGGAALDPQAILDGVAAENRMLGEKAYESFVCAGFDTIHLPLALEGNPMVRPETRCPACQAWTWVRPGHEKRCPHDGMPLGSNPDADAAAAVDAAVAGLTGPQDASAQAPAAATGSRPSAAPPPAAEPAAPTTADPWSDAADSDVASSEATSSAGSADAAVGEGSGPTTPPTTE